MDVLVILFLALAGIIVLDLLAVVFGADSREAPGDHPGTLTI